MAQRSLPPFNVMKTRFRLDLELAKSMHIFDGTAWNGKCFNFRLLFLNVVRDEFVTGTEFEPDRIVIYSLIPRTLLHPECFRPENELDCTLQSSSTSEKKKSRITTQMKSTRSPIPWMLHRIQLHNVWMPLERGGCSRTCD